MLLTVEEVLDQLLDLRDTSGSSHQHDFVDLVLLELGLVEHVLHRLEGLLEEVVVQLLELSAGDGLNEVLTLEQGFNLDLDLVGGGQLLLDFLGLSAQFSERLLVARGVQILLGLELLDELLGKSLVEVFSSQVSVSRGGDHLEEARVDVQERHVESSSSQVVDEDVLLVLLVQTVGDGCGGGLIDDSEHVEAGNDSCVLGGLSLGVVEVSGHSHDRVLHLLAELVLGDLLHLAQDHGRDLLRAEGVTLGRDLDGDLAVLLAEFVRQQLLVALHGLVTELASDQSLGVEDGVVGVECSLILGGFSNQSLSSLSIECDPRRSNTVSEFIGDDFDSSILPNSYTRLGGTQIYSNDWTTCFCFSIIIKYYCNCA